MPAGRPTKYRSEFVEQAYKLCLLNATDEDLADFFKTSVPALHRWSKSHPEFRKSITDGKIMADAQVAEKLFHRACGYSHEAVKIFNTENGPVYADYVEHYPPDTQAASLWLRNRQPRLWRDKVEVTGDGGGPVVIELVNYAAAQLTGPGGGVIEITDYSEAEASSVEPAYKNGGND